MFGRCQQLGGSVPGLAHKEWRNQLRSNRNRSEPSSDPWTPPLSRFGKKLAGPNSSTPNPVLSQNAAPCRQGPEAQQSRTRRLILWQLWRSLKQEASEIVKEEACSPGPPNPRGSGSWEEHLHLPRFHPVLSLWAEESQDSAVTNSKRVFLKAAGHRQTLWVLSSSQPMLPHVST